MRRYKHQKANAMTYPPPTAEAVDAEVARLQARYDAFMQARGETPDPAQLRDWATENVREQIILEYEAKAAGKTVAQLMESIVAHVPEVTVEEARAVFREHPEQFMAPERVHAQHLVLHRGDYAAVDALQKLLQVRAHILSGKQTWEDAVAEHSACAANSDLGFFPRGAMEERFEEAAFAAEEGSITDVVESSLGWHLIRVVAHLPEEPMLFEEAKEMIMASLRETRGREALEQFLDARKATTN